MLLGSLTVAAALILTARWGLWSPADLPFNSNAPLWSVYGNEGK